MGVWIETIGAAAITAGAGVTPFVGVWIETWSIGSYSDNRVVTPFVGVWIETNNQEEDC